MRVSPTGDWFTARVPHKRSSVWTIEQDVLGAAGLQGQQSRCRQARCHPHRLGMPAELGPARAAPVLAPFGEVRGVRVAPTTASRCWRAWSPSPSDSRSSVSCSSCCTLKRSEDSWRRCCSTPETRTYSLARAQFFWWLTIIAVGYLFLFFAQGIYQGQWRFPSLEGFAVTFVDRLGTLLLAQATSSIKGAKGAGLVHPAPANLIVHGGVLAPNSSAASRSGPCSRVSAFCGFS